MKYPKVIDSNVDNGSLWCKVYETVLGNKQDSKRFLESVKDSDIYHSNVKQFPFYWKQIKPVDIKNLRRSTNTVRFWSGGNWGI
jgi:hypothetical protein